MKQKHYDVIVEYANEMHPHQINTNHTIRLLNRLLVNPLEVGRDGLFDAGKYYDRMLHMLSEKKEPGAFDLSAILKFKYVSCGTQSKDGNLLLINTEI